MGWAITYEHQQFGLFRGLGSGDLDTMRFGPYFGRLNCGHQFFTALSSGFHWSNTTRNTAFGEVSATPVDYDLSWAAAYGYRLEGCYWNWMPTAALYYTIVMNEPYAEENASAGAMRLQGDDPQSLRTVLGGRFEYTPQHCCQRLVLSGGAGWMHNYLETGHDFSGQFLQQNESFLIAFAPTERDAAFFDFGVSLTTAAGATLSCQYFSFASTARQNHGGALAMVVPY